MVRDRMPDLQAIRNNTATFGRGFLQDVHIQMFQNKKVKRVLDEVEEIRSLIQLMVENIDIVKDLHNNVLAHADKDIQKELENRTYAISQTAFRITRKLREMGKDITTVEDLNIRSAREGPIYMRIRVLQYTTMLNMYSEIMQEYNGSLMRYHDKCLLLLQQQRSLIRRQITSRELDDMLDAHETSLFVDNILEDSRIARRQLSDIQCRHDEVLRLEKSIAEIRDTFTEMAFLIEKQGDQLNSIEYFAGKTTDNIDSGRRDLHKAEHKNRKYGKRKIKLCIILCVIIVIFLLIVIFL